MRAFHNSRALAYRAPYGAVAAGTPVTLGVDVEDAPSATVRLRTWVDGTGEGLYDMTPSPDAPGHFEVTYTPEQPGVVWYHFIVTAENGESQRYGTRDGRVGGEGELRYGEPPSYQLTVYATRNAGANASDIEAGASTGRGGFNLVNAFPFQQALESFLRGEISAYDLAETVETMREIFPTDTPRRTLGLLDHAVRARQFTQLAGYSFDGIPFPARTGVRFDASQEGIAKGRLWCASLLETLMPNVKFDPADYAAVEDALDATCSCSTYPQGCGPQDCSTIARNAVGLSHALPLFESGDFSCFAANDDVFGFWRRDGEGRAACVLVNASLQHAHDVLVPMEGEAASELISGYGLPVVEANASEANGVREIYPNVERFARVHLNQLGSAIAYFHARERLGRTMEPGLGVLAHITSLPAGKGSHAGTLGAPSRAFVDWLADAGVRYWQVLPVNPTDNFGSPYAGISAFAGNTRLLEGAPVDGADLPAPDDAHAYQEFCEHERYWLEPYACFMAIRQKLEKHGSKAKRKKTPATMAWQDWPEQYRHFDAHLIESDEELRAYAESWRRAQFAFEQQWKELRAYANERGVQIIGDMPIYVSADSSDVWAYPELFQLGPDGHPAMVAGCPPDQFAAEGQVWGNPVYDWDAIRASGYDWWLRRLERAFELYDVVRLDHFIGFSRYYSIPLGEKATTGRYHAGPGIDLFRRAYEKLGPLPIIAEDLGHITPSVRTLSAACGFPGMDIVQFVDGNDPLAGYAPRPEKIAYTGTHDNQTLIGYCEARYPELDAREAAWSLVEAVVTCDADVCVVALQDLLGLDDSARMNTPGTAEGNWNWQATKRAIDDATARTRALVQLKA